MVNRCLHCLEEYDHQGGTYFVCPTCQEQQSPTYQGPITGRQLIRALRTIGATQVAATTQVKEVKG